MQLGYSSNASFTGDMVYHSVVESKNTWWTLNLGDVSYDGNSIKSSSIRYAIIDSSSRMIYMAESDY